MPLIRDKHASRKCFASIDSSYSYPEYERGNLAHLQRPVKNYFPQHSGLSRLDRLVQSSLPKIYEYCGSVLIRPRFFWYNDFIKLVALPSSQMSGLWRTFGFKTSSTESSWTYFCQSPKCSTHQIMSTSTGVYKTRYNLQKASRFRQDIKDFLAFLYHSISTKS